ncbi:MAG: SIMPL domain-containing protein, partial [Chitinophagaceae bacterium]
MKNNLNIIIAALALIIGIIIFSEAFKYKTRFSETITVTGLSEKDFVSDLIVWGGSFSRNAYTLKDAYALLKKDEQAIRNYLNSKGINDSSIIFTSVNM